MQACCIRSAVRNSVHEPTNYNQENFKQTKTIDQVRDCLLGYCMRVMIENYFPDEQFYRRFIIQMKYQYSPCLDYDIPKNKSFNLHLNKK